MSKGFFIVELFNHKAPVVWSYINDFENAITIFNDVLIAELTGNPNYIFCNDAEKPGYYTTANGANYYINNPVQSFELPNSTLCLVPVSDVPKL